MRQLVSHFSILLICTFFLTQGTCEAAQTSSDHAQLCSPRSTAGCAELTSAIHQDFRQVPDGGVVSLRSSGGSSLSALRMARTIIQKELGVKVVDFCMSACLSLLLPAFREIEAVDHPLILAHGSSINSFSLIEQELGYPVECFERFRNIRELVFEQRNIADASSIQIAQLGLSVTNIQLSETCATAEVVRTYDAWAPTSLELAQHFELEIEGPVAADDRHILQARINAYLPPETTVRSGGAVFVSAHDP